jgi:hypothetical protein
MGPSSSFLVVNLFCLLGQAIPASVRYDQSQSGETNIHHDLKNIEILAVLDDTLMGSVQVRRHLSDPEMHFNCPILGAGNFIVPLPLFIFD